jgi:hypothetical protein
MSRSHKGAVRDSEVPAFIATVLATCSRQVDLGSLLCAGSLLMSFVCRKPVTLPQKPAIHDSFSQH